MRYKLSAMESSSRALNLLLAASPLLTLHKSRLAPIGVIGQIESLSRLDNKRHFLAACDGKLNLFRRIGSFYPPRQQRLTVGQHDKHTIPLAVGLRIEA